MAPDGKIWILASRNDIIIPRTDYVRRWSVSACLDNRTQAERYIREGGWGNNLVAVERGIATAWRLRSGDPAEYLGEHPNTSEFVDVPELELTQWRDEMHATVEREYAPASAFDSV